MRGLKLTRRGRVVFSVLPLLLAGLVGVGLTGMRSAGVRVTGPEDAVLGAPALAELAFEVSAARPDDLEDVTLVVDGEDRSGDLRRSGNLVRYAPRDLEDGDYEVAIAVQRPFPRPTVRRSWRFTVDTTPPEVELSRPVEPVWVGHPTSLVGRTDAGATVRVDRVAIRSPGGRFVHLFDLPPEHPVLVTVTDDVGNVTELEVVFETTAPPPRRPAIGDVRAVHVTPWAFVIPSLRDPVYELARQGKINTVQLDLKDESGLVPWDSEVVLAQQSGAARGVYDLEEAIAELHDLGVYVIGRLVAFRDPILAAWAWENGRRDLVLQTPDGEPYAGYGGFTNFAHPDVRAYNIDLAEEAAAAGINDILWDYVRRPDGPLENLVVPGLEGTPEEAVVEFVAEGRRRLEPYGVFYGASVYGIASTRPTQIAQDIPGMAEHVDYIAPMLYPSHWAPGEYDVPDPNSQPYEIVHRSLVDFLEAVDGTAARIVPWLQDFSLGVAYGPPEVRAQIQAAHDVGISEWILWSPRVRYTADALDPIGQD